MARFTEWFVHCAAEANDAVAEYLAAQGRAAESPMHDVLCADGVSRNLWRIEGRDVKRFAQARTQNPSWKIRFYTKSSPGAIPAHFAMKPKKKKAA